MLIDGCENNLEKPSTTKLSEHIPSTFSMSKILSIKNIENKHAVYRAKDSMRKFRQSFRKHSMKITNFKNKKVKLLTNKQQESYENAKICYNCKEIFEHKYVKDKKYGKVRDHFNDTGVYTVVLHIVYVT